MKKIKLLLVFLSLLVVTAFAHEDSISESKSTDKAIDLTADKGTYDPALGIAIYEGNVKVTQGIVTIWADTLIITLKDNAAEKIEASGKPVKVEYLGDKQPIYGSAEKAVYKITSKTVTLSGNAQIKQGEDVVKGSLLTYDLDKEIIAGSRVKMTFLPKK